MKRVITLLAIVSGFVQCLPAFAQAPSPAIPVPTATPACSEPYREAKIVNAISPNFPQQAVEEPLSQVNVALVRVTIDPAGNVIDATIYRSTDDRYLDAAALRAAKDSTYEGALDNCIGVTRAFLFHAVFWRGDPDIPLSSWSRRGKAGAPRCLQRDSAPILFQGGIVRWPPGQRPTTVNHAVIKVTLSSAGAVRNVSIDKSTGSSVLDQAALETARNATFIPACRGGFHEEATFIYKVDFDPNEASPSASATP